MANIDVTHVPLSNGDTGIFRDQDAIRKTSQTLSDSEKTQARTNIGAVSSAEVEAAKPIKITISNVQIKTYSVSDNITNIEKITAAHELMYYELSNSAAMGSAWTITSGAGTVQVAGTLVSGQSTNLTLKFELPQS